jgi:adenine-specific DNA-methyltransferase
VPHVTLKSIAQNVNLDPIFAKHGAALHRAMEVCNHAIRSVSDDLRTSLAAKLAHRVATDGWRALELDDADYRRWLLPGTTKAMIEKALASVFAGTNRKATAKQIKAIVEKVPARAEVGPSSIPEGEIGWEPWQVPFDTDPDWPKPLQDAVTAYRAAWRAKMDEVNACIAANADQEELVDQPEIVKGVVRVSGPFTVEGVMPAELSLDAEGLFGGEPEELESGEVAPSSPTAEMQNVHGYLTEMVGLIRDDGVNFLNNEHRAFARVEPRFDAGSWNGIHAEAAWRVDGEADDGSAPATVAIGFGPQYGPVTAAQVEDLIREANRAGYDELIVAGFSFDPEATSTLLNPSHPKLRIHAAQIRPDVNPGMKGLLKQTPTNSQLFTVFGLPSIEVAQVEEGEWQVTLEGVDIYDPVKNEIRSTGATKVAAWFIDGDYDGRTFCTTQAFFPDQDAWEKLAKALGDVVEPEAFEAFKGTVSLPFPAGKHNRIAVKVIDPRGNEVMTTHDLG